jgi:hypothetical protein
MAVLLLKIAAALIFAAMAVGVIIWLVRNHYRQEAKRSGLAVDGDLSAGQEKLMRDTIASAKQILDRLVGPQDDLTDVTVLSRKDLVAIHMWLGEARRSGVHEL